MAGSYLTAPLWGPSRYKNVNRHGNRTRQPPRARSRCHFRLRQAEDLAQSYRDKLADLEARIRAIAPELELPVRFRRPNPVFKRTELTRLALAILREADEPLPIRVVAVRALKAKGIAWPDPALRRRTRTKLREAFGRMRTRG